MWSLGEAGSHGDGETVTCLTLDDVYRREGIPTLIKIDAEGAELEVLRGGTALFAEAAPRIIVEFTDGARLQGARELLPNYRFRNIGENHWMLDPR